MLVKLPCDPVKLPCGACEAICVEQQVGHQVELYQVHHLQLLYLGQDLFRLFQFVYKNSHEADTAVTADTAATKASEKEAKLVDEEVIKKLSIKPEENKPCETGKLVTL